MRLTEWPCRWLCQPPRFQRTASQERICSPNHISPCWGGTKLNFNTQPVQLARNVAIRIQYTSPIPFSSVLKFHHFLLIGGKKWRAVYWWFLDHNNITQSICFHEELSCTENWGNGLKHVTRFYLLSSFNFYFSNLRPSWTENIKLG